MTSVLPFIKRSYYKEIQEPIDEKILFTQENVERCGKQFVSIMVSSSLIKSETYATNRDVSSSFKKFEEELIKKMKITKKEAYKTFGNYCLEQLTSSKDQKCLELELAKMFFKELNLVSKSKAEPISNFKKSNQNKEIKTYDSIFFNRNEDGKVSSDTTMMNTSEILSEKEVPTLSVDPETIRVPKSKLLDEITKASSNFKGSISTKISETKYSQELNENYYKPQTTNEDDFEFEETQKDIEKKNKIFSSEDYFIDVVGYLLKLPSPQGELTYIWQHLKWQGFETYYEPFMNEALEWTCTARITFPPNMYDRKFMERTQSSKNKKKARQMACMDLLKSLYLEYPEVWMLYKHLKEEKRLVIAAVDEPKDEEEIALIRRREKYTINTDKVERLFRHNKTDIRQMMEKISAKAELNTLLQQLPGRVTSPKLEKKPVQGNWLVPVRIEYKTYDDIQNNRNAKVYEKNIVFHNTKIAEEEGYMEAIIEMYQENSELFEKIQSIKLAKGIKEPEKKLPLMRTLKDNYRLN